jgi:hypothetical protein
MQRNIYDYPYGLDAWETSAMSRCIVHIVNRNVFHSFTDYRSPTRPFTAQEYKDADSSNLSPAFFKVLVSVSNVLDEFEQTVVEVASIPTVEERGVQPDIV